MSDSVFPSTLNGYTWDSKKKPTFNNVVHSSATGRDVRISLYSQPVYEFVLSNQWLTKADKDSLIGFFIARKGAFDSFLYLDEDGTITRNVFGVGDGHSVNFQLAKTTGDGSEIVQTPYFTSTSGGIYNNGVLLTRDVHYSLAAFGAVTMAYPPAVGDVLSWTGLAYYRCVFMEDSLEYNQFANRLYDCSEVKFKGSLANKL